MKANKESAMKALAKRPKLLAAIVKGTEFHKLKTVGQVSGGFIRSLLWAEVCQKDKETGVVTLSKGIKERDFKSLSETHSEGPTTRVPKKALTNLDSRKKSSKKGHRVSVEVTKEKRSKKGIKEDLPTQRTPDSGEMTKRELRQAAKAERKRIRLEKKAIREKNKAEKAEAGKAGPITKRIKGKLLRPVKGIPANHKIDLEYQDGFWWASDKNGRYRIATTNIKEL